MGQVLWARRIGQNAWQFPQGGINASESPEQAMYRELKEEIGLSPEDVEVIAVTRALASLPVAQANDKAPFPSGLCRTETKMVFAADVK